MQITFREGNTETALKKWVGVGIGNHAQIFTAELLNKMSEHSIHHFPLKQKDFSQKQFDFFALVTEISFLFFLLFVISLPHLRSPHSGNCFRNINIL